LRREHAEQRTLRIERLHHPLPAGHFCLATKVSTKHVRHTQQLYRRWGLHAVRRGPVIDAVVRQEIAKERVSLYKTDR
jgi:hypothetical protein